MHNSEGRFEGNDEESFALRSRSAWRSRSNEWSVLPVLIVLPPAMVTTD